MQNIEKLPAETYFQQNTYFNNQGGVLKQDVFGKMFFCNAVALYLWLKTLNNSSDTVHFLQIAGLQLHDYFSRLFDHKWKTATLEASWTAMQVSKKLGIKYDTCDGIQFW